MTPPSPVDQAERTKVVIRLATSAQIIDPLLRRETQGILARHNRPEKIYTCPRCAQAWPCEPRHNLNNPRVLPRPRKEPSPR